MSRHACARSRSGEIDATLLALAGLKRLGLARPRRRRSSTEDDFPPAVGQGAIAITARAGRRARRAALVAAIGAARTAVALAAERAFLAVLDGSCRTPIAGHAVGNGGAVRSAGS